MDKLLNETKITYYNYVSKVAEGSIEVAKQLRSGEYDKAFQNIVDFTEGIEWLIQAEQLLLKKHLKINSRTLEAIVFLNEVNTALENKDYILAADLFEYEISVIFDSASEWVFEERE